MMAAMLAFLLARLKEPSSWQAVAVFSAATGAALAKAGLMQTGIVIGAIGAGIGAVGQFIAKENP
jgi:hypothetical protein